MSKSTLEWYEDNAQEIRRNEDGSVTFVFDEPWFEPETGERATSSTTVSKVEYEKALAQILTMKFEPVSLCLVV